MLHKKTTVLELQMQWPQCI